jgi:hypothetical protein
MIAAELKRIKSRRSRMLFIWTVLCRRERGVLSAEAAPRMDMVSRGI